MHVKLQAMPRVPVGVKGKNSRGFPIYWRPNAADKMIVSHNRLMLLDWDGHCNVVFAGSTFCVLYLYKYLFKGAKKVSLRLNNADDVNDEDEHTLYLRGRKLCSMDAMWRTLCYQTYPAPFPAVKVVKIREEKFIATFRQAGKVCDMDIYLSRPDTAEFNELTYTKFNNLYITTSKPNARTAVEMLIPNVTKRIYLSKRLKPDNTIVRLSMLYLTVGEAWYLRLIFLKRPVRSYVDAKTHNGQLYTTFQQSAVASGFITDNNEAAICFNDCVRFSSPPELRGLFVMMTIQGFLTVNIFNEADSQLALMQDFYDNRRGDHDTDGACKRYAYQDMLNDLHMRFARDNKNMTDYGLPEPDTIVTELMREELNYNAAEQFARLEQLNTIEPNNVGQQQMFDKLSAIITRLAILKAMPEEQRPPNPPGVFEFVNGSAGCGKSSIAKKIIAFTRSKGLIAKGCAATNLAAQVYDDFVTAHTLFKLPVVEDNEKDLDDDVMISNVAMHPERLELLKHTSVIVWDEFPSNNKECFEAAFEALDGFRGKIVIFMGDWKQMLPVVPGGTREDIIGCSND